MSTFKILELRIARLLICDLETSKILCDDIGAATDSFETNIYIVFI